MQADIRSILLKSAMMIAVVQQKFSTGFEQKMLPQIALITADFLNLLRRSAISAGKNRKFDNQKRP